MHVPINWVLYSIQETLVAQTVKNLPPMQVRSLGLEDPLEKGIATYSSILACEISWTEEPDKLHLHGVAKSWT